MPSYCGVGLTILAPEQTAEIAALLDPAWIEEFCSRNWPGLDMTTLGFRGSLPTQPVKIGSLYWPAGASRFATGHFIASEAQLAAIRQSLAGSSGVGQFVVNDGNNAVTASLGMLPARPLYRVNTSGAMASVSYPFAPPSGASPSPCGLYLLTLIDDRFSWWFKSGALEMTPGTTTWEELYALVGALLGVSITVDAIPAAYEFPAGDFATQFQALPTLLDAIAFSVGQRIVRRLDGSVHALNAASGQASLASNLSLAVRLAGDAFDLAGGSGADVNRALPAGVRVTFPVVDSTSLEPVLPDYASTQSLASLGIAELSGATGFAGQKVLHCTATAISASGTVSNTAELDALAAQAARDWYRWSASGVDALYSGAVAWEMDGFADLIEFIHTSQMVATRVQRGPWLDHIDRLLVYGVHGAQSGATYINQTITNINTTTSYDNTSVVNYFGATSNYFGTAVVNYFNTSVVNYFGTTVNIFGQWYIPINQFWIINGPGILVLNLFVQFTGGVEICGEMYWCYATVPTFDVQQVDDLDLRAVPVGPTKKIVFRISSSESQGTILTGVKHYGDGQVYQFIVVGENPIILAHETGSAADRQFTLPGGIEDDAATATFWPGESFLTWWDPADEKWKLAADTGVTADDPGQPGTLALWTQANVITPLAAESDGQLPIGAADGTFEVANLTAGDGIEITNAAHAITIATKGFTGILPRLIGVDCSSGSLVEIFANEYWVSGMFQGFV